jgi:hypothetical protein
MNLGLAILIAIAITVVFVGLDHLANRWFQSLPEPVRKHGLLALLFRRFKR